MYHIVQHLVHGDYKNTLNMLTTMLEISEKKTVVELGCGDGGFSKFFIKKGLQYYGIDNNSSRIKVAQKKAPQGKFFVGDVENFDFSIITKCNLFFCHSLLHHLDDNQCNKLIKNILSLNENIKIVVVEPVRPETWYSNPIRTIIANLDDGNYIRTLDEWKKLLGPWIKKIEIVNKLPRWPELTLFAQLSSN